MVCEQKYQQLILLQKLTMPVMNPLLHRDDLHTHVQNSQVLLAKLSSVFVFQMHPKHYSVLLCCKFKTMNQHFFFFFRLNRLARSVRIPNTGSKSCFLQCSPPSGRWLHCAAPTYRFCKMSYQSLA